MDARGMSQGLRLIQAGLRTLVGLPAWPMGEHDPVHDELERIVRESRQHGVHYEAAARMLARVLEFRSKRVRDVMRPRTQVVALPLDATEAEVRALLLRERYSRYPVYNESLDDVVGMF